MVMGAGVQGALLPRPVARPVLVLQPGWGVTLPPHFLGMMDVKRPRSVPVKVSSFCQGFMVLEFGVCDNSGR